MANSRMKIRARRMQARFANYSMTEVDYLRMLADQNGRCAICSTDKPGGTKVDNKDLYAFHIDHCHKAGGVRGLLCQRCNLALGLVKDSKETLWQMLEYLALAERIPAKYKLRPPGPGKVPLTWMSLDKPDPAVLRHSDAEIIEAHQKGDR